MTALPPKRIGSVRILERLGEGGMAVVHRAEDLFSPGKPLAVKFLKPEAAANPEILRRFLREGQVLKSLVHPNLVEVLDFGHAGSTPYILMELLPGGSVKGCMGEAPAVLLRRLVPVAEAVAVAHAAGVVHRDLKPSNLLFASDGRLKVTDFGVCLWEGGEGTRVTRSQMVVGTLGYMAPEQHGDPRRVDGRCDVYALGAILYEFATGQPYSQVQLPPAAVRPGFPPRLAGILLRSLAPSPAKRTPSMTALAAEWQDWLESAEAAGWGEEPLPGYSTQDRAEPTLSQIHRMPDNDSPQERLGPCLDALYTGDVGSRRAAQEALARSARPGDGPFLLEELSRAPQAARFGLVTALGVVGGLEVLPTLLDLLEDPFARTEAATAASLIALRGNRVPPVLDRLRQPGLGASWRWPARARLGDGTWVEALLHDFPTLTPPQRLQALEAARLLPDEPRGQLKAALRLPAETSGGSTLEAWSAL